MDEIYVFGRFGSGGGGHHTYAAHGGDPPRDVSRLIESHADVGGLDVPRELQHEGEIARREWSALSLRYSPGLRGWSLVTWWDRRGDQRYGSASGVIARGQWAPWQLAEAARRLAPWAVRVPLGAWSIAPSDGPSVEAAWTP